MTVLETEGDYDWLDELRSQAVTTGERETPAPMNDPAAGAGRLVVFRSLTGGVGRSSLALNFAFEAARARHRVCLVDLDLQNPSLHALLGVHGPKTAVLAGVRLAEQGRLDSHALEELLVQVEGRDSSVGLLTCGKPVTGFESHAGLAGLISQLTGRFDVVVADSPPGAGSELHRLLAQLAEKQYLVVPAEPVSLARLFEAGARSDLAGAGLMFNRVRADVIGSNPQGQITSLIQRHGLYEVAGYLPLEQEIFDLAQQRGLPLRMVNARSKSLGVLTAMLGGRDRSSLARRHRG